MIARETGCGSGAARSEASAFHEPASQFWPGYFWFWNDELEPDLMRVQLHEVSERGARSACPHPVPVKLGGTQSPLRLVMPGFEGAALVGLLREEGEGDPPTARL